MGRRTKEAVCSRYFRRIAGLFSREIHAISPLDTEGCLRIMAISPGKILGAMHVSETFIPMKSLVPIRSSLISSVPTIRSVNCA